MPVIYESDYNPSSYPSAVDQLTKAFAILGSECYGSVDSNDSEDVVTVLTNLTDLEEEELLGENDSVLNHLHNDGEALDLEITYPQHKDRDASPAPEPVDAASARAGTWGHDCLNAFSLVSSMIL